MTNKDLKGMTTTEMVKCESCSQYHPLSECEVVVIKMIKGKNCSIKSETRPVERIEPMYVEKTTDVSSDEIKIVRAPEPPKDEEYGCTIDKTIWVVKGGASDAAKICPTCGRQGTAASVLIAQSGTHIPPAEMEQKIKERSRKTIIPKGLVSMMVDPSDPNFETKGAKEIRRV
jgi:hypothetical protein